MNKIKKYVSVALTFGPVVALAATATDLITTVSSIVGYLVPLLIAVAVVVFLWGVVQYVTAGGEEEKRKKARGTMVFGIVGLFVMVAVWGLVSVLTSTFGITEEEAPLTPTLPSLPSSN